MNHGAGIVVHIHHVVRVGNLHALRQILNAVLAQHLQDFLPPANQGDLHTVNLGRLQRAQYRSLGGVISAHCVKNNPHCATSFFRTPRQPVRR